MKQNPVDKKIHKSTSIGRVIGFIQDDFGITVNADVAKQIRTAASTGSLMYSTGKIVTTDSSRIRIIKTDSGRIESSVDYKRTR